MHDNSLRTMHHALLNTPGGRESLGAFCNRAHGSQPSTPTDPQRIREVVPFLRRCHARLAPALLLLLQLLLKLLQQLGLLRHCLLQPAREPSKAREATGLVATLGSALNQANSIY